MNFDLSLEGENKNTYGKVTVFHTIIFGIICDFTIRDI